MIEINDEEYSLTDGSYDKYYNNYYEGKHNTRKQVVNWICESNLKYFATVTFKFDLNESERTNQIKSLIRMMNNRYFSDKERNENKHLEGFVFIEKENTRNSHYHILFIDNSVFQFKRNRNKVFPEVFKDNCRRMVILDQLTIDVEKGVDVQEVYSDQLVTYLTKTYEETNNFDFIHYLNRNGFC